ncbi:hypothetical protein GGX14DRAFT_398683 [Mycena pura]|uniref:Uncharacterized protein n=1 Tax=Mycena pura TaxID=153505 RepID=A0AAD6VCW9_9AGAR|nr:hypothetical protein GGX14DRAFT_398683 [Mycena pura]
MHTCRSLHPFKHRTCPALVQRSAVERAVPGVEGVRYTLWSRNGVGGVNGRRADSESMSVIGRWDVGYCSLEAATGPHPSSCRVCAGQTMAPFSAAETTDAQ